MLDIAHQQVQDLEPTVSAFKAPTHASFLHVFVAIHHHGRILFAQQLV
jgi:hypothetical protein